MVMTWLCPMLLFYETVYSQWENTKTYVWVLSQLLTTPGMVGLVDITRPASRCQSLLFYLLFLPCFSVHCTWTFLLLSLFYLSFVHTTLSPLSASRIPRPVVWKTDKSIWPLIVHRSQDPWSPSSLLVYQLCIFFICFNMFAVFLGLSIDLW